MINSGIDAKNNHWIIEFISPYESNMHNIKKYIVIFKTPFQTFEIVETNEFGKRLFKDGRL
ncbi:MAG: hypothetical protein AABY84_07615 [Candidatus Firestonebacteria bacterium]